LHYRSAITNRKVNNMNTNKMAMSIIIAMMVTVGFAATATAINVNGDCTDWPSDSLAKDDPVGDYAHAAGDTIGGYDLTALYLYYESGSDTLFIRLDVDGKPADLDGNGNTDTNCDIAPGPGDCPGVGDYEHYSLGFSSPGKTGTAIVYKGNAARKADGTVHPNGDAQYGASCIEFSLSHASSYINLNNYCLSVTAGGMQDDPGEDTMDVCIITEVPEEDEFWTLEWFLTNPHQYTQFILPDGEQYLTTLSWIAPESCIHIWDNDDINPIAHFEGERVKFWHDPMNDMSDIYANPGCSEEECSIRVYGTFGEGPGNHEIIDPATGLRPENPPYTDPIAPGYPQADQAPMKDFVTFNPAIMDHNMGYPLDFDYCEDGTNVQSAKEKVFKRMWYEKDWFKDANRNNCWDVVIEKPSGTYVKTLCIEDEDAIHAELAKGYRIREHNNPEGDPTHIQNADIYGPAVMQEFTYMFLDEWTMPIMVESGSRVLIPMAHDPASPYRGLNSFDADGNPGVDTQFDPLRVESEQTLGINIDQENGLESMDGDDIELSNDETVVLVLTKRLVIDQEIQFFDHKVKLENVYGPDVREAELLVSDNEGGSRQTTVTLQDEEVELFYRAKKETKGTTFYVKVKAIDWTDDPDDRSVRIEVGRMFGQTAANIAANIDWSQKAFIVDNVFYNVVAIKADENCIKYITFRQKLPKEDIKLYGVHLERFDRCELLPEMSPFNMEHYMCQDVQSEWTDLPMTQQDKIGPVVKSGPLRVEWTDEDKEERFKGELKEIYWEDEYDNEFWAIEWFLTQPIQYTEFHIERSPDAKYLLTSGFYAPESCIHLWDGGDEDEYEPMRAYTGERVKFWFTEDCEGLKPLYIDEQLGLRIYGGFGEGPGDHTIEDPATGLKPENPPYTDPIAPFYPQAEQSPRKDFVTFNPAIMDHNRDYPIDFDYCDGTNVQSAKEKVFKRMWYEKDWFKDANRNGCWDVVIEDRDGDYVKTLCLEDEDAIHAELKKGNLVREYNNPEGNPDHIQNADIYGPAVMQEFAYMFLDQLLNPIMIESGSRVLIPMAHDPASPYRGLNSFDADGDPYVDTMYDPLRVESEETLGIDIDQDTVLEPMDGDGIELSNDETVVLVLEKRLEINDEIQFFDHKVELLNVYGPDVREAELLVSDNEGGSRHTTVTLEDEEVELFYRAVKENKGTTFYVKVKAVDWTDNPAYRSVRIEVGRMFGQTAANIAANIDWSQKAFIVDEVFYNVVAIKADDNCIKYIVFRQKLPKNPIKLYGVHLEPWYAGMLLPEMPPFNMEHDICEDVQSVDLDEKWSHDKIGPVIWDRPPLVVKYTVESKEPRYYGELKEIYWEDLTWSPGPEPELMEGDVNLDEHVTITDAMYIAQYKAGLRSLSADQLKCADTTDADGVTISDAMHIAQWRVDPDGNLGILFKPLWQSPADDDMLKPVR
jgi:hypothetical protein